MTTEGDRKLDSSLAKIGGKGLFVKELEDALARGAADIAVHSMKDVPMDLMPGHVIAAITERADPRDAFVSNLTATSPRSRRTRAWAPPACGAKASCVRCVPISRWCRCGATYRRACASSTTASTTRCFSPPRA